MHATETAPFRELTVDGDGNCHLPECAPFVSPPEAADTQTCIDELGDQQASKLYECSVFDQLTNEQRKDLKRSIAKRKKGQKRTFEKNGAKSFAEGGMQFFTDEDIDATFVDMPETEDDAVKANEGDVVYFSGEAIVTILSFSRLTPFTW